MQEAGEFVSLEGERWKELDEKLREKDETNVQDCTADIDALLTFAGLYSGILTAFLVVSYPSLQPDPQQKMIELLERISLQTSSYTVYGNYINSTLALPLPASFHASRFNICVNVCWFSSLILSLSTASFAILVKQWLREYLAIPRTAPQERVRIRHYRHLGSADWKLFEIAAILPLFLHLSLAIFFAGLCLFTFAIHTVIGVTSVVLIGGWAIFFLFSLLAPILSPRCPFKTRFLRVSMRCLRVRLREMYISLAARLGIYSERISRFHVRLPRLSIQFLSCIRDAEGSSETSSSSSSIPTRRDFTIVHVVSTLLNATYHGLDEEDEDWGEEDEMCTTEINDLTIFKQVDAVLADESVLETMWLSLRRYPREGTRVLNSVITTLQNRLNILVNRFRPSRERITSDTLELAQHRILSPAARTHLMNILADSLLHQLQNTTVEQWLQDRNELKWMHDALTLILSLASLHDIVPDRVTAMFRKMLQSFGGSFSYAGCAIFAQHTVVFAPSYRTPWKWQSSAFTSIAQALGTLDPRTLGVIVRCSYLTDPFSAPNDEPHNSVHYDSKTYPRLLEHFKPQQATDSVRAAIAIEPEVLKTLIEVAAVVLHAVAKTSGNRQQGGVLPSGTRDLLLFILEATPLIERLHPEVDFTRPQIPNGIGLDQVFMKLFTTPALVYTLLECLGLRSDFLKTKASYDTIHDPLTRIRSTHTLSEDDKADILSVCAQYCEERRRTGTLTLVATLRLCHLVINFHAEDGPLVADAWRDVFDKLVVCLEATHRSSDSPEPLMDESSDPVDAAAYLILRAIDDDLEDGKKPHRFGRLDGTRNAHLVHTDKEDEDCRYTRWRDQFSADTTPWRDDFIALLCGITKHHADRLGRTFWRVRRLRERGMLGLPEAVGDGRKWCRK
ncbi:hypothetical protein NM688_g2501 [Phlebia brevispora]|uniref:Uncharacterized protein n=1 Tax=Phlebia brevispora TaxID=194682 RepID=A0ACC1T851_9APHY|nr:hypothetical protein NM688_g2501 [Phlebia brevispora]